MFELCAVASVTPGDQPQPGLHAEVGGPLLSPPVSIGAKAHCGTFSQVSSVFLRTVKGLFNLSDASFCSEAHQRR